jgi:pantetheine-phosphate adenylyltransferase
MRVIAGRFGGRRLTAGVASVTRPTADRVREALGSVLESRGAFEGAVVLDLFAGTGALGIEALSRGAARLVAIDWDRRAIESVTENLSSLAATSEARVVRLDLLKSASRVISRLEALREGPFRLIFADPPYRELKALAPLLDQLAASKLCAPDALFVIEHAGTDALATLRKLVVVGRYSYGDSALTLLARSPQMGEGVVKSMATESSPAGSSKSERPEYAVSAAVYAGSFDPITNGHVAIIKSGLVAFERIIVAVLTNTAKKPMFTVEERMEMISDAVGGDPRVEVDRFDHGLLVNYAREKGVRIVLRGLRAVGDFEHELQMANMNRHLDPGIETVFIMANDWFYVSSTLIKEAAVLGGDLHGMVPELVEKKLREKFGR